MGSKPHPGDLLVLSLHVNLRSNPPWLRVGHWGEGVRRLVVALGPDSEPSTRSKRGGWGVVSIA